MIKTIEKVRKEYNAAVGDWKKIDDICDGDNLRKYLVELNPSDKSAENVERNEQYYNRAIFYAIAGYTARGLSGMMFSRVPKLLFPAQLEYINENVDGGGVSIYQQSQIAASYLIRKGRAALLVDYPTTDGAVSRADMETGELFATISLFRPEQVTYWDHTNIGARHVLSKAVIVDCVTDDDGEEVQIRRELALEDRVYVSRLYHLKRSGWELVEEVRPTDATGGYLTEIPFIFLGSETNTSKVDKPPMLDVVNINVGHFRNSADYEDTVYFCGQVQPWMSGLTQQHIDEMQKAGVYIGSRQLIGVPDGQQFGFAAAPPNIMPRQAMIDKVEMSVGLGAMFIQGTGGAVKTATQAEGEQRVQQSVLSLVASNLSEGYTKALKYASLFMGTDPEEVEYAINQDFAIATAEPQRIQAMVAAWMAGALPQGQLIRYFQKQDIIDPELTSEEVIEMLPAPMSMPNLEAETDDDGEGDAE